jgi:hypothetical protein
MPLVEQELLTLAKNLSTPSVFTGVRVTRSLVLCVCFLDRCLSSWPFSFGHCVVCLSIYGFWLPLWYLQTLLKRTFVVITISNHPYTNSNWQYTEIFNITAFENCLFNLYRRYWNEFMLTLSPFLVSSPVAFEFFNVLVLNIAEKLLAGR